MTFSMRIAALLAVALTFAFAASTASAALIPLNVVPPGASVATSVGRVTFTSDFGIVIECESSKIRKTVASNGSGTVAVGDATYDNCEDPLGNRLKGANTAQWTLQVVGELLATSDRRLLVGLDFTIPAAGLTFTSPGRVVTRSFTLSGNFTLGKLFAPQALPISQAITPLDQFIVLPLPKQGFIAANAVGCAGQILNGDVVTKGGRYTLDTEYTATQREPLRAHG